MFSHEPRNEDQIHCKHRELLKTLFSRFLYPLVALFGVACAKVVQCPFSPSMVAFPEQSSEESCCSQIRIGAEHVNYDAEYPDGEVECIVLDGVMFLLLFLFLRRLLDHSWGL